MEVGRASVAVEGDVSGLARTTERKIDAALSSMRLDPVNIPVDVDGAYDEGVRAGRQAGEGFTVGADSKLRDSKGKFAATGKEVGTAAGAALGKAAGQAVAPEIERNVDRDRIGKTFELSFSNIGRNLIKLLGSQIRIGLPNLLPLVKPALITTGLGIVAGIAAVVGPALGSAIGAAVLAAGGLGIIGLGAFLLKEEPALKRAASQLVDSLKSTFQRAAQPLLGPLIDALGIFRSALKGLGPELKEVFAGPAGAVDDFARGLVGLVDAALPGLAKLSRASEGFLKGFAEALPAIGTGLSHLFAQIAKVSPELTIFWQDFIFGISWVIAKLGDFIAWSARTYVAIKQNIGGIVQIVRDVRKGFEEAGLEGAFKAIQDALPDGFFERIISGFVNLVNKGLVYFANNAPLIIDRALELKEALVNALLNGILALADKLPEIIPVIIDAAVDLVDNLVDGLVKTAPRLVEAAGALVNGLVDGLVQSLPTLIPGAVSIVTTLIVGIIGLIPTLIDAGIRLVRGLTQGLVEALPEVARALITAIPQIVDAVLTALPALLLAGTDLLLALVQGFADGLPQLITVIQSDIIPLLVQTLTTQGPQLIAAGTAALVQFIQGWTENVSLILDLVTNVIIPTITSLFQDNPEVQQAAIDVLNTLLTAWSQNISILTDFLTDQFFPALTDLFAENPEIIQAGVDLLTTLLTALADNITLITDWISESFIPAFTEAMDENGPQIAAAGAELMVALLVALIKAIPDIIRASGQITTALVGGLIKAIPSMSAAATQLIVAFIKAIASTWAAGASASLGKIKSGIISFFSGAGSWLASAGRAILDGLIGGIRDRIGDLRGLLGSVTDLIPDWKGPAERDAMLLYDNGRRIMDSLTKGLNDRKGEVRDSLQDLTGEIGGINLGGKVRGGDGASSGQINLTVEAGAIVINARKREDGEEAAEALLERLADAVLVR